MFSLKPDLACCNIEANWVALEKNRNLNTTKMILCPHTEYQVCFPTLVTDCELEEGGQSVELYTEQHCTEVTIHSLHFEDEGSWSLYTFEVVRTACVERQRVEDFETGAFSFTLKVHSHQTILFVPKFQWGVFVTASGHWGAYCGASLEGDLSSGDQRACTYLSI